MISNNSDEHPSPIVYLSDDDNNNNSNNNNNNNISHNIEMSTLKNSNINNNNNKINNQNIFKRFIYKFKQLFNKDNYTKENLISWKNTILREINPTSGDVNAVFSVALDNLANFASISAILIYSFGMPGDLVMEYFLPGPAFSVMIGSIALSIYAIILAHENKDPNVFITAIPIGLDSPSAIGIPLVVIGPSYLQFIKDGLSPAEATREAFLVGCCTTFFIGIFKLVLTVISFAQRQFHPVGKASALAGIGIALLGLNEFLEVIQEPVVGFVSLWIVLLILLHRANKNGKLLGVSLPFNISPVFVSAIVGTVVYYFMAGVHISVIPMPSGSSIVENYSLSYPHPANVFKPFSSAIRKYISIAIPYAILVNISSMTVSDTAKSIGQPIKTSIILSIDSLSTIIGSLFGSTIQTTAYIGHTVYHRKFKARSGYSIISGLIIGLGGFFGYLAFLLKILPKAAIIPIFIFIAFEICHETFYHTNGIKSHHSPAIFWALFPSFFQFVYIIINQIAPVLSYSVIDPNMVKQAFASFQISDTIITAVGNIMLMANGFICTALFWGTSLAYILDNKLKKASIFLAMCSVLTFFGIIHSVSPTSEVYVPWNSGSTIPYQWSAAYVFIAILTYLASFLKPYELDDDHHNNNNDDNHNETPQ